ncbi:MAG: FAD-dependent monooxygenase [Balneolaceae bacterium]|nr:MAG: FAD-dependent monooxygenase [Balneolaceae bacterium]
MSAIAKDIVIAGGGATGLYLAGRLLQLGFSCRVLEAREAVVSHSRSLGIHPVSLELFRKAGIEDRFLQEGIPIRKGHAFWDNEKLGEVSFEECPAPFNFILALPQWKTEKILEEWVQSIDENAIVRNAVVSGLNDDGQAVTTSYTRDGIQGEIRSRFLIGCDGKKSTVRQLLKIPFSGSPYPDYYIMGDFTDNTGFGEDAAVYLHSDGLVESFPLPGGMRRWVVKTQNRIESPSLSLLTDPVERRTGFRLHGTENSMLSSFGVEHYLADILYKGNSLLAGDAAHVVSPIGGQGMNLGWLDAEACVGVVKKAFKKPRKKNKLFKAYSSTRRKKARIVARRAAMNMWLGRSENSGIFIKQLMILVLRTRLSVHFARMFTMRGVEK